jgi:hypothetical protein
VVAISSCPDASGKGAEGESIVTAAMLFQELLVVYLGVLILVGAVIGRKQGGRDDGLI